MPRAHAHNDYQHPRPLLDALDHGFCSVEADIFCVGVQLLVAHDPLGLRPDRTLEALYLKPLAERVAANDGSVYPHNKTPFFLLIDFKHQGEATYAVLREQLANYSNMLTTVRNGELTPGAVTVVISGDCPRQRITADSERHGAIDGRLSDLSSDAPAHLIPWISDSWPAHFAWRGEGDFSAAERAKLQEIVKKTHAAGRRLRFWAAPDNQAAWQVCDEAGVDLINTDDLPGLQAFLRKGTE